MEPLALHTGAPIVYCEDNTSCTYVVEASIVTPIVTHIELRVCLLQDQFYNGVFF